MLGHDARFIASVETPRGPRCGKSARYQSEHESSRRCSVSIRRTKTKRPHLRARAGPQFAGESPHVRHSVLLAIQFSFEDASSLANAYRARCRAVKPALAWAARAGRAFDATVLSSALDTESHELETCGSSRAEPHRLHHFRGGRFCGRLIAPYFGTQNRRTIMAAYRYGSDLPLHGAIPMRARARYR